MTSLRVIQGADDTNIVLQYRRAIQLWSSHCADAAVFGEAAAYANAKLSQIEEANCVHGVLDAQRAAEVARYFADANSRPLAWHNPETSPAIEGLSERRVEIWRLDYISHALPQTHTDLMIIPARAAFTQLHQIAAIMRPAASPEQAAEAAMCHLDDSHVDAIIALRQGEPVAYASVISTGQVGFIMDLFVREEARLQGIGNAMAGRMLDICARSLFRTVCCPLLEANEIGKRFVEKLGFSLAHTVMQRAVVA